MPVRCNAFTPENIYVIFLVKEGEKPKSSKDTSRNIVVKIDHIPTVSEDNILNIKGKRINPEPI